MNKNVSGYNYYIRHLVCLVIAFGCIALSANAQTFYKTPSGKKYHTADCRMVKNVSRSVSVSELKKAGLEPCKICNPKNIYTTDAPLKKVQGQSATVQCKGSTKAGTRCRHKTSIANGYCYHHQPK
ncbi:MAG: DUF5763 domain-containing protein [Ginsengibacter sp.]